MKFNALLYAKKEFEKTALIRGSALQRFLVRHSPQVKNITSSGKILKETGEIVGLIGLGGVGMGALTQPRDVFSH